MPRKAKGSTVQKKAGMMKKMPKVQNPKKKKPISMGLPKNMLMPAGGK